MNEQNKNNESNGVDIVKLIVALGITIGFYVAVCYRGLSRLNFKRFWTWYIPLIWFAISCKMVIQEYAHLRFFHYILGGKNPRWVLLLDCLFWGVTKYVVIIWRRNIPCAIRTWHL